MRGKLCYISRRNVCALVVASSAVIANTVEANKMTRADFFGIA